MKRAIAYEKWYYLRSGNKCTSFHASRIRVLHGGTAAASCFVATIHKTVSIVRFRRAVTEKRPIMGAFFNGIYFVKLQYKKHLLNLQALFL